MPNRGRGISAKSAFYFLIAVGSFMCSLGHYVLGPALLVLAVVYDQRIVAREDDQDHPLIKARALQEKQGGEG